MEEYREGLVQLLGCGIQEAQRSPLEALRLQWGELDWDYMVDRTHGELLLDLGIAFHPKATEDREGIVGLWRLDQLLWSYARAGYSAPTVHHSCTLKDYGNIQAEMNPARRRETHIAFRQSYNLAFEVVRSSKQQLRITTEAKAWHGGKPFRDDVEGLISALQNASGKPFGVREEIRLGGSALYEVLDKVPQLVSN